MYKPCFYHRPYGFERSEREVQIDFATVTLVQRETFRHISHGEGLRGGSEGLRAGEGFGAISGGCCSRKMAMEENGPMTYNWADVETTEVKPPRIADHGPAAAPRRL